ncbi:MAG: alpha/beta hydrolase [Chloroflexi bacterium]|nr:MAG: alpha/beta hydrolase [Chloroflexota bacterium]
MSFVEVGGLRLHFQQWGPPDAAESVVLVHGLGSSSHIWDLVGPSLGAHGFRVVAHDQRGHGQSDQPDQGYDFGLVLADLVGLVDAIGVNSPALFVGHSWGASVVLHFAVAHPDRCAGICLVDGGTASPGERWSWEEAERRLRPPDIDGMRWADLHQRMSRNNGAFADPRAEAVGRSLFHVDADGRVTRRFRISNHMQVVRAMWEQRPSELLPRVTAPLLIMPTRQASDAPEMLANKSAGVQRALELQPAARVRWFEDSVHDVPLQRPDEVAAALLAFARQVLLKTPAPP